MDAGDLVTVALGEGMTVAGNIMEAGQPGTRLGTGTVAADQFAAPSGDEQTQAPASAPPPMARDVWYTFDPPERLRVYQYAVGPALSYHGVSRFKVDAEGHHFIETIDGRRAIVAPGWRVIELEIDGWMD